MSTPTPVETEPPIEVYVLTDAMFEEELSAVEREARLQQGLPVPATLKLDNDAQLG